jgi:hypothetical protein
MKSSNIERQNVREPNERFAPCISVVYILYQEDIKITCIVIMD